MLAEMNNIVKFKELGEKNTEVQEKFKIKPNHASLWFLVEKQNLDKEAQEVNFVIQDKGTLIDISALKESGEITSLNLAEYGFRDLKNINKDFQPSPFANGQIGFDNESKLEDNFYFESMPCSISINRYLNGVLIDIKEVKTKKYYKVTDNFFIAVNRKLELAGFFISLSQEDFNSIVNFNGSVTIAK